MFPGHLKVSQHLQGSAPMASVCLCSFPEIFSRVKVDFHIGEIISVPPGGEIIYQKLQRFSDPVLGSADRKWEGG